MQTENKSESKSLVLIILLLMIISVLAIVFFVLKDYNKPKPITINNNQQQTNNDSNNTNSQEPRPLIPGWNVYENKEYGFRIDYPSDWRARGNAKDYYYPSNIINLVSPDLLNPNDPLIADYDKEEIYYKINNFDDPSLDNFFMNNSDISIFCYSKSGLIDKHGVKTIKELIEAKDGTIDRVGKIQISGIEATEFIWRGEGESYIIIFENNGYVYEIVLNRTSSKENISDAIKQILSTFQLTK